MRFETVHGTQVPKIGFGTWRIGGEKTADPAFEESSKSALRSALQLGYTHFDTAEYYALGHAEELLAEAIHETGIARQTLFITSKVSPRHLKYEDVLLSCEQSLRRLQTEYLDLYLIHWPNPAIPLPETFMALNQLVREKKVRHLGVSNFDLQDLKQAKGLCETPLLTDQVPYSLTVKSCATNGVLDYCRSNHILLTAYSPVKFNNLDIHPTLNALAKSHQATPHQIALAWLVAQPGVITVPMSYNSLHQKENLDAAEIELSAEEMETMNHLY